MGLGKMRKIAVGLAAVLVCIGMPATARTGASSVLPAPSQAPPPLARMPSRPSHVARLERGLVATTNWAGWVNTGATFTDVRASWTQPGVSCPTTTHQYAAFWVGIDGQNSNSVEQIGTDSDCLGTNRPTYYGWYEMYPAAPVILSSRTYPIAPRDLMSAIVSVAGSRFDFELVDWSRGWVYRATQYSSTARRSSAEWMAEAPSSCNIYGCTVLPLADFGSINFTKASTVGNGRLAVISTFPNDALVMLNNTGTIIKAVPSALNSYGSGFSVTWRHS